LAGHQVANGGHHGALAAGTRGIARGSYPSTADSGPGRDVDSSTSQVSQGARPEPGSWGGTELRRLHSPPSFIFLGWGCPRGDARMGVPDRGCPGRHGDAHAGVPDYWKRDQAALSFSKKAMGTASTYITRIIRIVFQGHSSAPSFQPPKPCSRPCPASRAGAEPPRRSQGRQRALPFANATGTSLMLEFASPPRRRRLELQVEGRWEPQGSPEVISFAPLPPSPFVRGPASYWGAFTRPMLAAPGTLAVGVAPHNPSSQSIVYLVCLGAPRGGRSTVTKGVVGRGKKALRNGK